MASNKHCPVPGHQDHSLRVGLLLRLPIQPSSFCPLDPEAKARVPTSQPRASSLENREINSRMRIPTAPEGCRPGAAVCLCRPRDSRYLQMASVPSRALEPQRPEDPGARVGIMGLGGGSGVLLFSVCVCVYTCVHMEALNLFFETGSLGGLELPSRPGQLDLLISASPALGLQACMTAPSFLHVGFGGPNSGPGACKVSTWPAEPSSLPPISVVYRKNTISFTARTQAGPWGPRTLTLKVGPSRSRV